MEQVQYAPVLTSDRIITFFFSINGFRGLHYITKYSPGQRGEWGNIKAVDSVKEADFLIILNGDFNKAYYKEFPPERILYYNIEPDEYEFTKQFWKDTSIHSHFFKMDENQPNFAFWGFENFKDYDFYKNNDFPVKTRLCSWLTTSHGDGVPPGEQNLPGHLLRWKFLNEFINRQQGVVDIYGHQRLPMYVFPDNHGPLFDKWWAYRDYRYHLVFMNSWQNGFFDEKIVDAVLGGCMPLFWGCPDLEKYIPKNSFIRVDISNVDDAINKVVDILRSDIREQNLDELHEAKRIFLDELGFMPRLHRDINMVANKIGWKGMNL